MPPASTAWAWTVGHAPLTPDDYIRRLEMVQREVWPQVLAVEK